MEVSVVVVVIESHWDWIERVGKIGKRRGECTMNGVGEIHDPVTRCLNTSRSSKVAMVVCLSNKISQNLSYPWRYASHDQPPIGSLLTVSIHPPRVHGA